MDRKWIEHTVNRCWEHSDGCPADLENQVSRHKGFHKFPILNPPHPPVIGTKALVFGLMNNLLVNATWAIMDYNGVLIKPLSEGFSIFGPPVRSTVGP